MPKNKKKTNKVSTSASSFAEATEDKKASADKEDVNEKSIKPVVPVIPVTPIHDELKDLIEKNIKWSQVIYNQNKKIKHRMTMMVIGNYLRLFLIIAPIIIGIIYLPPLMAGLWEQYSAALGLQGVPITDIGGILKQLQGAGN